MGRTAAWGCGAVLFAALAGACSAFGFDGDTDELPPRRPPADASDEASTDAGAASDAATDATIDAEAGPACTSFADGFEMPWSPAPAWTVASEGALEVVLGTEAHTGTRSIEFASASSANTLSLVRTVEQKCNFHFEVWMKIDAAAMMDVVTILKLSGSLRSFDLYVSAGQLHLLVNGTGTGSVAVPSGTWFPIVIDYETLGRLRVAGMSEQPLAMGNVTKIEMGLLGFISYEPHFWFDDVRASY